MKKVHMCGKGHIFDSDQPLCLICLNLANQETANLVKAEKLSQSPSIDNCGLCGKKWHPGVECIKDVAQQPHYTQWKIQPITFITTNKLNFCQGNVIKYVMRYNQKNGLEDLKKAKVYIDYLIQELETGEVKP